MMKGEIKGKFTRMWKNRKFQYGFLGTLCLLSAAGLLALGMGNGARAEKKSVNLGNNTIELEYQNNAYQIETSAQLQKIGNAVSGTSGKTFQLVNDIDLGNITQAATGKFEGTFDGNGHVITIQSVKIADNSQNDKKTPVNAGVLFGTVTGTIQNLIVDIEGETAYEKKSDVGLKADPTSSTESSGGGSEFSNYETAGAKISGFKDADKEAYAKIQAYSEEKIDGETYKVYDKAERTETTTTTYKGAAAGDDGFGIICGKLDGGTIRQVLVDGESMSVVQAVLESGDETETKTVTTPVKHYYKISSETPEPESKPINAKVELAAPTVVDTDKTVKAESDNQAVGQVLELSVSAPKETQADKDGKCNIVYQIVVKNLIDKDLTNITIQAPKQGIWKKGDSEISSNTDTYSISSLSAKGEETLEFVLQKTGVTGNTSQSTEFQVSTLYGDPGQLVQAEAEVNTSIYKEVTKQTSGVSNDSVAEGILAIKVSAPVRAEQGQEIRYQVQLAIKAGVTLKNIEVTALGGLTETSGNSGQFEDEQAAQNTVLEYTENVGTDSGGTLSRTFTATGMTATGQKIKAEQTVEIEVVPQNETVESSASSTAQQNLKIEVQAAPVVACDASGKATILYTITLTNEGDYPLKQVNVAADASIPGGIWSGDSSNGVIDEISGKSEGGAEGNNVKKLTYSYPYTYQKTEDAAELPAPETFAGKAFTVSASGVEKSVASNETTIYPPFEQSVSGDSDSSGVTMKVTAPGAVKKDENGGAKVVYQVTLTNTSDSEIASLSVKAEQGAVCTGITNSDGSAGTATNSAEAILTGFAANAVQTLTFTKTVSTDVTSSVTENFTVKLPKGTFNSDDLETVLYEEAPSTGTEASLEIEQKLEMTVAADTEVGCDASGKAEIHYEIVLTNTGQDTLKNIVVTPDSGITGTWSADSSEGKASIAGGGTTTLTYVREYSPTDAGVSEENISGKFTATINGLSLDIVSGTTEVSYANTVELSTESIPDPTQEPGVTISVCAPSLVEKAEEGTEISYLVTVEKMDENATGMLKVEGNGLVCTGNQEIDISALNSPVTLKFTRTVAEPSTNILARLFSFFTARSNDGDTISEIFTATITKTADDGTITTTSLSGTVSTRLYDRTMGTPVEGKLDASQGLTATVSVLNIVAAEEDPAKLIYQVKWESTGEAALTAGDITISPPAEGEWMKDTAAGDDQTETWIYSLVKGTGTDPTVGEKTFTVKAKEKTIDVTSGASSVYFPNQVSAVGSSNTGVTMTVKAPGAVVGNNQEILYQVELKNERAEQVSVKVSGNSATCDDSTEKTVILKAAGNEGATQVLEFKGTAGSADVTETFDASIQGTPTPDSFSALVTTIYAAEGTATPGSDTLNISPQCTLSVSAPEFIFKKENEDAEVEYTITLTNTGSTELSGLGLNVVDLSGGSWKDKDGKVTNADQITIPAAGTDGATETFTYIYIDNGSLTNGEKKIKSKFQVTMDSKVMAETKEIISTICGTKDYLVGKNPALIGNEITRLTVSAPETAPLSGTVSYTIQAKVSANQSVRLEAISDDDRTSPSWSDETGELSTDDSCTAIANGNGEVQVVYSCKYQNAGEKKISFRAETETDGQMAAAKSQEVNTTVFDDSATDKDNNNFNTEVKGTELHIAVEAPEAFLLEESESTELVYKLTYRVPNDIKATISTSKAGKWGDKTTESESILVTGDGSEQSISYKITEALGKEKKDIAIPAFTIVTEDQKYAAATKEDSNKKTTLYQKSVSEVSNWPKSGETDTSDSGLTIKLSSDNKYVEENGKVTYTLELQNKKSNSSSDNDKITYSIQVGNANTALAGWKVEPGKGWSDSTKYSIDAGKTVILTKTVSAANFLKQSITLSGTSIKSETKPLYIYSKSEDGKSKTPQTSTKGKIYAGNHLNAGVFAGIDNGSIVECEQNMETLAGSSKILDASGKEVTNTPVSNGAKVFLGGVVGKLGNGAGAKLADLYIKGKKGSAEYIAGNDPSVEPKHSIILEEQPDAKPKEGDWENWKIFQYYDKGAAEGNKKEAFDLAWLVKEGTKNDEPFFRIEPTDTDHKGEDNLVKFGIISPLIRRPLSWKAAYQVRPLEISSDGTKTIEEEKEFYAEAGPINVENPFSINLHSSGYYRMVSVYATDGYYHYYKQYTKDKENKYPATYPYKKADKTIPPDFMSKDGAWSVERTSEGKNIVVINPDLTQFLEDISSNSEFYYTTGDGSQKKVQAEKIENGNGWSVPFDGSSLKLIVTPVAGGKVYEDCPEKTFENSDKLPLPDPEVQLTGYYDEEGDAIGDVLPGYSSSGQKKSYEKGSPFKIDSPKYPADISYSYWFSTSAPSVWKDIEWQNNSYIGKEKKAEAEDSLLVKMMLEQGTSYSDQGESKIPGELSGNYYLYVKGTLANYPDTYYCYGPFEVIEKTGGTPQFYYDDSCTDNKQIAGTNIANGDILKFRVNKSETLKVLQYQISGENYKEEQIPSDKWKTYSEGEKIAIDHGSETLKGKESCYIFTRMSNGGEGDQARYGEANSFNYNFVNESESAQIAPKALQANGKNEDAAPTRDSDRDVTLESSQEGAKILFYQSSRFEDRISLQRVTDAAEITGKTDGSCKYFQVGERWYKTKQKMTEYFDESKEQIVLKNEKDAENTVTYVHTVVLTPNAEPKEVSYVYQVLPRATVSTPEATLTTPLETGAPAEAALDTFLSFYSQTAGAKLYYIIGGGSENPNPAEAEAGAGNTKVYQTLEGIKVTGNPGETFTIKIMATKEKMKNSQVATFVYVIKKQEGASAPTSTPATTSDSPTPMIPGDKILLSTNTKGAKIYYTIDGSSPIVEKDAEGIYKPANTATMLYDTTKGIEMPESGTGYFTIRAIAVSQSMSPSAEVQFPYAFPGEVQGPYANVPSGDVAIGTEVCLKNRTEGAQIYYNVGQGNKAPADPTISSAVFDEGQPIVVNSDLIIKAIAVKDGIKSGVVSFSYKAMDRLKVPSASIESGTVVSRGTKLELKADSGAQIYYTTDGSDPKDSANSAVIQGDSLTLDGDAGAQVTVKACAKKDGNTDSDVTTFTYQISQNSGNAGITADVPNGSEIANGSKINLMTDVTGAKIYYTTDGSDPDESGIEGTVVTVNGKDGAAFTIRAMAEASGVKGASTSFTYKIKEKPAVPSASPAGGVLTVAIKVELGASVDKIYYTTDGTTPTESSTLYAEPILINKTTTLNAIAVSESGEKSEVASFQYTAAAKAEMPKASLEDGSLLEPGAEVTLHTDTPDAKIYYSTDGTTPTLANLDSILEYTDAGIAINRSVTIKAAAYREDLQLSPVGTWNYVVETIPAVEIRREEEERQAAMSLHDTDDSLLERQEDYEETAYRSRILHNQDYGTVVSSSWASIPSDAELVTEEKEYEQPTLENVKKVFGQDYTILNSYEVSLTVGETIIQPNGIVEIGFPIPEGYENAAVDVIYVDSEDKVTKLDTRRKEGMVYAKVEHFSNYALVGLEHLTEDKDSINFLLILTCAASLTALIGLGYAGREVWRRCRKNKK